MDADSSTKETFIKSWQIPENIFLTLHYIYKLAVNPFRYKQFKKILKEKEGGNIMEYGAGMAPIITSMLYDNQKKYSFYIADIRNYPYHYAKYRLKQYGVKFYDIEPTVFPKLQETYDVVFLQTVLEHLPDPLEVITKLSHHINKGGYLIFDYILSDGSSLDTKE